jgi:hypothetical protein
MLFARLSSLMLFGGVLLAVSGCAHNSYDIASRSPSELKVVSDADLCYAQRYWTSPNLQNEIALRRLDCRTGARVPEPKVVTKKAKKPSKPSAGVAEGTVSKRPEAGVDAAPVDLDAVAPPSAADSGDAGAVDLDAVRE